MAAIRQENHADFHWTPWNVGLSVLVGVAATLAIWLFTGLLLGLFML